MFPGASVWPPPLQELPVGWTSRHVEGSRVDQQLTAWRQRYNLINCPPHNNKNRWCQSHQPLTFPAVELCELRKPHVVANPHTHFTERCGRSYKVKTMLVQLRGKKTGVERRHLRVSNTDKLLPGLSVSDSWKRIFPGTSMSKRWIWKEETFKEGRETLLSS